MDRINWQLNTPGNYCYRDGLICDHNHIDGPVGQYICSGILGKCDKGSKYEYYEKSKRNRIET